MDTTEKLSLLADASRYDLSCACGTKSGADHRKRGAGGLWLYPVSLPNGGVSIMLKTLLSNVCVNDCRYCPFRNTRDIPRTTMSPDEVAATYMQFVQRAGICGLFLSSGVIRDADYTMDRMTAVAEILRRKHEFKGFIHLKIIPGASDGAIEQALRLSHAVSLNIEVPRRSAFSLLSSKKDFDRDIIAPMKRISELTAPGMPYEKVKKITQFIVGAADEIDADIVQTTWRLYKRLRYNRVYFSAYQRGLGDPSLPGEQRPLGRDDSASSDILENSEASDYGECASSILNPQSAIQNPKSKIKNQKSQIPLISSPENTASIR